MVSKNIARSVMDFDPYSSRIGLIKIKIKPVHLNVVQVYALKPDATDQELEEFYREVKDLLKLTKKHEVNIIMGDLNAKLGKDRFESIISPLVLVQEMGEKIAFCSFAKKKI